MDEMKFNLSKVLKYSHKKGEFDETGTIFIEPPSYSCMAEVAQFEQFVSQAVMDSGKYHKADDPALAAAVAAANEARKDAKAGDDTDMDGKSMRLIIMASSVKITDVIENFKTLLIKVGRVAENKDYRFIKEHFSELAYEDIVQMLCEYAANFIAPSLLSAGD